MMLNTPNEPEYVSTSSALFDAHFAVIHQFGIANVIGEVGDIIANLDDVFQDMPFMEACQAAGISIQDLFNELEVVFPFYVKLLDLSLQASSAETYFEEGDAKHLLGVQDLQNYQLFPKLLLDDGTKVFALMQIAGHQAKLGDRHVRFWYQLLMICLVSMQSEQDSTPIQ